METLLIFGAKYLFLVIVAVAVIYFFKQTKADQKQIIRLGIISLPISYIIAKIGGALFYNSRPFVVEKFTPLIAHIADNGFPSDHTLLSASIAFVIYFFNRKLGWILLALTLIVGFSRVYVGVHHLTDIFGSIIIAGVVVLAITHLKIFTK